MDSIEEELRAIREEMARLRERIGLPEPRAYRFKQAATMLGVSISTLKRLVLTGEIVPSEVGNIRVIAASEIERLLSRRKTQDPASARTPRRVAPRTSKGEGARIRDGLKPKR